MFASIALLIEKKVLPKIRNWLFSERMAGKAYTCGLIEQEPDDRDFQFGWFGGSSYTPKNRVVDIKPLQVRDQNPFNNCTQQAAAAQKELDEGIELSTRYLTTEASKKKRISGDGFATIRDIQQTVIESGVCEANMLPEDKSGGFSSYADPANLKYCLQMNGMLHRSKAFARVSTQDEWFKALDEGRTIQTGMRWYTGYNMNGGLTAPWVLTINKGIYVGGHSFLCTGYDQNKKQLKFLNSYGGDWGDNGCFYIKYTDWWALAPVGYVSVDINDYNPAIIQYEGKDVKSDGDPRIFRIENGKKRWYPDEKTFLYWGGNFNPSSFVRISGSLLKVIPEGEKMNTDVKFTPNLG